MATITWKIVSLRCYPEHDGQSDVIETVSWLCEATENNVTGQCSGVVHLNYNRENFTPYTSLSEAEILQWCWDSGVNKESVEAAANYDLQNRINTISTVPKETLPWVTNA